MINIVIQSELYSKTLSHERNKATGEMAPKVTAYGTIMWTWVQIPDTAIKENWTGAQVSVTLG